MKILVNLATISTVQWKCLSQMGQLRDDEIWEGVCDPEDFDEAIDVLKQAGIEDVVVQFGE